jgi:hypothetical protein
MAGGKMKVAGNNFPDEAGDFSSAKIVGEGRRVEKKSFWPIRFLFPRDFAAWERRRPGQNTMARDLRQQWHG